MSNAWQVPDHEPIVAKPRPDAYRAAFLAKINVCYENTLRYLGK